MTLLSSCCCSSLSLQTGSASIYKCCTDFVQLAFITFNSLDYPFKTVTFKKKNPVQPLWPNPKSLLMPCHCLEWQAITIISPSCKEMLPFSDGRLIVLSRGGHFSPWAKTTTTAKLKGKWTEHEQDEIDGSASCSVNTTCWTAHWI